MAFLAFEGLDGSGKSTLLQSFHETLRKMKQQVLVTREPGGSELAEQIRGLLLKTSDDEPVARCEILLYEAARAQHVEKTIRPALARGEWVLCDRFSASTLAFQSAGRAISQEDVAWLNRFATAGLAPDLNILLDITVEKCFERMAHRQRVSGVAADRLESESASFHQAVYESYRIQSQAEGWLRLDATQPVEELRDQLVDYVKEQGWLAC